ncbi:MAG: glucokinase [Acaryochloridaceae cyanobacterium SU_2_1]|nr:glucokinase [Acaryochloridaceae cyanobacterium SU_2_1]
MTILLVGDIGGTKTTLQLVQTHAATDDQTILQFSTPYEQTYPSQDYPDLTPIVQRFLAEAANARGIESSVARACFGIAGPVIGQRSELTNLSWLLTSSRLEQDLGIPQVRLLNDFAANSYGILGLAPTDFITLQSAPAQPTSPIALLGAGTGLGEGFLLPQGQGYQIFASEGGHTDFAPRNSLEFQLLEYLLQQQQTTRISVERVVSGQGILSIYQFLRDLGQTPESPQIAQILQRWQAASSPQANHAIDPSAAIAQAAIAQTDLLSIQTMELFVSTYGAEAGNLALKLLPYGGLYITGGIAPKILPLLQQGKFLENFQLKGRVSPLLQKVPVHVVLNPKLGLIGAALYAAQLSAES